MSWPHHLIILGQSKRAEKREFYLRLAVQERWSSRELERQFKAARFERSVLNPVKATAVVADTHLAALSVFREAGASSGNRASAIEVRWCILTQRARMSGFIVEAFAPDGHTLWVGDFVESELQLVVKHFGKR